MSNQPDLRPFICPVQRVLTEWIDYNDHMNVTYYVLAFDAAVDHFLDRLGVGPDYVAQGEGSCFVLQNHVSYLRELKAGDLFHMTCRLLNYDEKRIHYFLEMYHETEHYLAATSEQITLHVDLKLRRAMPLPQHAQHALTEMLASHSLLPRPPQVGSVIDIPHRPALK